MNVLFINPPELNTIPSNLPGAVEKLRGATPPINLMCVAAGVRRDGRHRVSILDAHALGLSYDALENEIANLRPDVAGIPVTTFTLPDVLETIKRVRRASPATAIVGGGLQVFLYPVETLRLGVFDYCLQGEADETFPQFLDALEEGQGLDSIPGLIFARAGSEIVNPPPPPADDLDKLPFPAHDLLPIPRYTSLVTDLEPVGITIASRGCPYRCAYCSHSVTGKKYRIRGPENVAEELVWCKSLGIRYMMLYDEVMTISREWVLSFCRLMRDRNVGLSWMARAKVGTLDEEMLREMRGAGCDLVTMGIESGRPRVLSRFGRPTDIEAVVRSFQLLRKAGMRSIAYFMIGGPDESMEDVRASLRVARRAGPDLVHAAAFVPYPATDLYEEGLATGRFPDYWREFSAAPRADFVPRLWVARGEEDIVTRRLAWFYRRVYLRPRFILSQMLRIHGIKDIGRNLRGLAAILSGKEWSFKAKETVHAKGAAVGGR